MKIIIIEDEMLLAEDLADILINLPDNIEVVKILTSVKEALAYFEVNNTPDIVFSDIELGDGNSFEIFKQIKINAPVIFCTAYNKYALEAFNNNGIGYILKPFTKKSIKEAIDKFTILKKQFIPTPDSLSGLISQLQVNNVAEKRGSSFLINWKDKIIPIKQDDIALFSLEHNITNLITKTNEKYTIPYSLEETEKMCSAKFFRANRQFLINRDVIEAAEYYFGRKLFLKLNITGKYEITVSKLKVPEFLSWLKN
jgi:two-component system, LytTR family, response regulator LytT